MRVVSGTRRSVSIVLRRIYSRRGHQLSANIFLKMETSPDATIGRSSLLELSSILNAIGNSVSDGSKRTISFVRDFGILCKIVSARSPWGSISPTPLQARISEYIIFSRRVDFPIQVFPMIYTCLALSVG